jgi:hypothetical protein
MLSQRRASIPSSNILRLPLYSVFEVDQVDTTFFDPTYSRQNSLPTVGGRLAGDDDVMSDDLKDNVA